MKIKRLPKKVNLRVGRDFGAEIKRMRSECGLSQLELAKEVGMESATAVSLWESNQRQVSAIKLWQIASVCGYQLNLLTL